VANWGATDVIERVPENKVIDFIDGTTLRNRTPEEYVRQTIARSFVHEYRYPRGEIAVGLTIQMGSSKKQVDLAIFEEGKSRKQEHIIGIVECKREGTPADDEKGGVNQLKAYMAACPNCRFGLWTNGSDQRLCFSRVDAAGVVTFDPIVDVPIKGAKRPDSAAPDRRMLRAATADNLLFAFRRCHNYIAGNSGLQKPEAFWELLKVIFCKAQDERSGKPLEFYVTSPEQRSMAGQLKCKHRVDALFEKVKQDFPTIFARADEIGLSKDVLAYTVAQLQPYSLIESPVDVKGVAYEEIVGANLRGDRGEFFTPRNACRMAVAMLDPRPGTRIIDPACGTGGFLITAMNLILDKFMVERRALRRDPAHASALELQEEYRARDKLLRETISGLDINPALVRAAKMNMVMNNDGAGGLAQANSLANPATWSEEARKVAPLGEFDIVITNPPFGTNIRIDSPDVLRQYELAAVWDYNETTGSWEKRTDGKGEVVLQSSQPPEILFIERCVQFLKPGTGVMAMVIPNGILNNVSLAYVRQWLLDNTQIIAVVDMQRDLFQPRNDTQTSMVLLRRAARDEIRRVPEYPIFFAVTKRIGHDKRGNTVWVRDAEGQDVLADRRTIVHVFDSGTEVDREIAEKVRIVDDDLPHVPAIFRDWVRANHIGV
jgi:type I restriction enzyme M protein